MLRRQIDLHPEQVGGGRGDDLAEARGRLGRRTGGDVGAPGALEEDHRFERVRIDPVAPSGSLDLRAELDRAARRGSDPSRALGVDHVRGADRRAVLELLAAGLRPGERVRLRRRGCAGLVGDPRDPDLERLALAEAERQCDRGHRSGGEHEQQRDAGGANEQRPARSLVSHVLAC